MLTTSKPTFDIDVRFEPFTGNYSKICFFNKYYTYAITKGKYQGYMYCTKLIKQVKGMQQSMSNYKVSQQGKIYFEYLTSCGIEIVMPKPTTSIKKELQGEYYHPFVVIAVCAWMQSPELHYAMIHLLDTIESRLNNINNQSLTLDTSYLNISHQADLNESNMTIQGDDTTFNILDEDYKMDLTIMMSNDTIIERNFKRLKDLLRLDMKTIAGPTKNIDDFDKEWMIVEDVQQIFKCLRQIRDCVLQQSAYNKERYQYLMLGVNGAVVIAKPGTTQNIVQRCQQYLNDNQMFGRDVVFECIMFFPSQKDTEQIIKNKFDTTSYNIKKQRSTEYYIPTRQSLYEIFKYYYNEMQNHITPQAIVVDKDKQQLESQLLIEREKTAQKEQDNKKLVLEAHIQGKIPAELLKKLL